MGEVAFAIKLEGETVIRKKFIFVRYYTKQHNTISLEFAKLVPRVIFSGRICDDMEAGAHASTFQRVLINLID